MKIRRFTPKTRTFVLTAGGFLLLALLLTLGRLGGHLPSQSREIVKSCQDRVRFLSDCGWEVDPDSEQEQTIHIPETFSPVYRDYNELQRQQGYDLADYAGQDCTLYTYDVTGYPDESQTVLANLYVFRGRVIGGDIHSTNLDGFMIGLK